MRVLVVGAAPCLLDDLEAASWMDFDRVYAANGGALYSPLRPDVWCMGHAEHAEMYQARWAEMVGGALPEIVLSPQRIARVGKAHFDRVERPQWPRGVDRIDSGYMTVKVALEDGATRVVVAGIPLDDTGNLNGTSPVGHQHERFRAAWWWARKARFADRVRGMSGYPAYLLGEPTEDWHGSQGEGRRLSRSGAGASQVGVSRYAKGRRKTRAEEGGGAVGGDDAGLRAGADGQAGAKHNGFD
jgi:hypothetical protein